MFLATLARLHHLVGVSPALGYEQWQLLKARPLLVIHPTLHPNRNYQGHDYKMADCHQH